MRIAPVERFDFDHGIGQRLAIQQGLPHKNIACIIGKWPEFWHDLDLEAQGLFPAVFRAERADYGLGIMDDETVLCRLKIRFRLDCK